MSCSIIKNLYICSRLLLVSPLGVSACSAPPANDIAESGSQKCTPTSGAALADAPDDNRVTFYRDLLPVLAANTRNRPYKCTTCHAHYGRPDGLNSVPEIERIVDSLKKGRMPRSNARVTEKEIELFDTWRLQGFEAGNPDDTPKNAADAAPSKPAAKCQGKED